MKKVLSSSMTIMLILSAPLWAESVFEDFQGGSGGFRELSGFYVSDGRFLFNGNRENQVAYAEWAGGHNPGGWLPMPGHSNYFENFEVSADVVWMGGAEDVGYGLSVCNRLNMLETVDFVSFRIDGTGNNAAYMIIASQNGEKRTLIDWTAAPTIQPNAINQISIFKMGKMLSFSINDVEITKLEIEGCVGGSVGMEASNLVDVAFDNFKVLPFITEDFTNGAGGFRQDNAFVLVNGQLQFNGDGSEGMHSSPWNGGYNPGGVWPTPEKSNYFKDVHVSADVLWGNGPENNGYGISVCNQQNSDGGADYVLFFITGKGYYTVFTVINGVEKRIVDWTYTPLITPIAFNELSILKKDNQFSFSINGTNVQQLEIAGCTGGSIDLEVSKTVNVVIDNFMIIDLPSTKNISSILTPPSTNTPQQTTNQRPIATFTVTPQSGKAPLIVNLDAGASIDPDGTIISYHWDTSDRQTAIGKATTMTFATAGSYTISLVVTDNEGTTSESFQMEVTVESDEPLPPPPAEVDLSEDDLLEFQGLGNFYGIGDKVVIDLVQKAHRNRFERIDLWIAIQMPSGDFLFKTDIPMKPFSPQPQAFKKSLESLDETERLLEFEVPPGLGGDYVFYAAFVTAGKNPVTNGLAIQEIASKKTTLAN